MLECIKKNVHFQKILEEIVYYDIMHSLHFTRNLNADLVINYFASELGCSPSLFFKKAEKTNEEYAGLLDYDEKLKVFRNGDGKTVLVKMPVKIEDNADIISEIEIDEKGWSCKTRPRLSLWKERDDGSWKYVLKLETGSLRLGEFYSEYEERFTNDYVMMDTDGRNFVTLTIDRNGKLKEFFEENIDWYWQDIAEQVSVSDTRFAIWIEKLLTATRQGLIDWQQYDYKLGYYGMYQEKKVAITLKENREFDISRDSLCIKFDWDYAICISSCLEMEKNVQSKNIEIKELRKLTEEIEKSIVLLNDETRIEKLEKKQLKYSDVIVITHSMMCKENNHIIIPYKGLVPCLDSENKEIFCEVYVGYCKECQCFYMFKTDFEKMINTRKLLCKIVRKDRGEKLKEGVANGFNYKSESILYALGYNVRANNNLTQEQRQQILLNAIEQNLLQTHEILDFLNWLVKLNTSKRGYSSAIDTWRTDIEYIKNTALKNADSTTISAIYVK